MIPAISQCPVVVSLPFDFSAHLPWAPRGLAIAGTPASGRMFPSPRLCKFGRDSCRDSQIWPNVSEPASPHSGASGIAPMPAPSRTIRVMRLKCSIEVRDDKLYNHKYGSKRNLQVHDALRTG